MTLTASIRKRLGPGFSLDVAIDAQPGITILFGESGSGKSTLLRCLAGLLEPDTGRIAIGDGVLFDRAGGRSVPAHRRNIGYVFQQLALFPHLPVSDNLAYGVTHLPDEERDARIHAVADRFRIAHLLDRRPAAISGGERQRVALARALVTDPGLLLLDEPLSALDYATQSRIIADLREWNTAHRIPILYVTHSQREVFALGDHVVVLERGRVLASGTPHEVMNTPEHEVLAQLAGFENIFDATVLARLAGNGVMQCRLGAAGPEIEVPLTSVSEGGVIRVAIRAGDIMVANPEPQGISARNVLAGTLTLLYMQGTTVVARVEATEPFVVHLTPGAVDALGLRVGIKVWLVIKTHSCRVVSPTRVPR